MGVILPALGYLVVHYALPDDTAKSRFEALGIDPATVDVDTLPPQLAKQLGVVSVQPTTELVAVVISASFCLANGVDGFHEAVERIPRLLRAQIDNRPEMVTRVVGVAVDPDPETGAEYLVHLAEFDEVIAGGSWLNTGTEKFLWGRYALGGSIPQIVVLQRTVTRPQGFVVLESERLVRTIAGADKIIDWVARGAPALEPVQASAP